MTVPDFDFLCVLASLREAGILPVLVLGLHSSADNLFTSDKVSMAFGQPIT